MKWIRARLDDIGPNRESHNERIKLIALTANAAGLAGAVTGVFGPLFDPARGLSLWPAVSGLGFWVACAMAAFEVLGYIKSKD